MPREELVSRMELGDMQTVTGGAALYPQVVARLRLRARFTCVVRAFLLACLLSYLLTYLSLPYPQLWALTDATDGTRAEEPIPLGTNPQPHPQTQAQPQPQAQAQPRQTIGSTNGVSE